MVPDGSGGGSETPPAAVDVASSAAVANTDSAAEAYVRVGVSQDCWLILAWSVSNAGLPAAPAEPPTHAYAAAVGELVAEILPLVWRANRGGSGVSSVTLFFIAAVECADGGARVGADV